jgi:CheY-like chemotaxis protein
MNILIVDDESEARTAWRALLEYHWHTVVEAIDGSDAMSNLNGLPPDVLITDQRMPGMDGVALCRRLREDFRLVDLPVILASGDPPPEGVEWWDLSLRKPVAPQALIDAVNSVVAIGG